MRLIATLLLVSAIAACASAPPAPQHHAGSALAEAFQRLDRTSTWRLAAQIPAPFDTHHPQGMVRIGGDVFVSSVEIITPTRRYPAPVDGMDRDAGEGRAHLFRMGPDGALKADLVLGEGAIYHPGGIDFDGRHIWVTVAEYRPDSRSILYRVDPQTMTATEVARLDDHIGGVAWDSATNTLVGVSWGARRLYRWPLQPDGTISQADIDAPAAGRATSHYIAWQDCHGAGPGRMLCTGLSNYAGPAPDKSFSLGAAELVSLSDLRPIWQVPIQLWSPAGRPMTQNPAWFETTASGLRAWFMPDDDASTLFIYDVDLPPTDLPQRPH